MSLHYNSLLGINLPLAPVESPAPTFAEFMRVYNAIRALEQAMLNATGYGTLIMEPGAVQIPVDQTIRSQYQDRVFLPATATIAYGDACNLYYNAGVLSVQPAIATGISTLAHGIAIGAANAGEGVWIVLRRGLIGNFSGLGASVNYLYLSQGVAGKMTPVKPASGIIQIMGYTLSDSQFYMDIQTPVV